MTCTNTQTEEKQAASIALCSDRGPAAHQIKMQWAFIDLLLEVCNSLGREMELEGEGGARRSEGGRGEERGSWPKELRWREHLRALLNKGHSLRRE